SIGCRLVGSTNLADYDDFIAPGFRHELAPEKSSKSILRAIEAEDFSITGPGEINGAGPAFFDAQSVTGDCSYRKPDSPRPRILMAYKCRNFRIEDASFNDSPCWTFWLMQCQGIGIHRIKMRADQRMINNDGIDLDMCRDVTVSDSLFSTGDDCVVLRSMRLLYETELPCENVTVSNCVLDSWCQGIRVGCPGDGVIRNCTFNNLIITGRGNGIVFNNPKRYLPTNSQGSADIRNILFADVVINCSNAPIKMDVDAGVSLPYLGGVSFTNFRIKSGKPIIIQGSPETIIRDVSLSNVAIDTSGEDAIICRHCQGVKLTNVELTNRHGNGAVES
ncbi:MAG: glycosyl hydrolase family 28 protein, partial [Kiritimatiellae bacterium]|nr:glycosyl hydrolase family 28 protein [Kiritimatiellia bacterium]